MKRQDALSLIDFPAIDSNRLRESLFNELMTECRLSAPGARLNAKLRTNLEKLPVPIRKEIASREKDRCTPLFIACKRGNVEIVEYLIQVCNVDLEQRGLYEVTDDRSVHYVTPLWCAAVSGKLDVIECLVRNGANVNAESDSGSTPVRSACFMTHLEIVKYLVRHGADIKKPNFNGGTCLINSVQSDALCKFLLENGADVNATDIQNKTALHYAIQEHRKETTKLLLDYGADPLALSRSGDDALQTACLKGATQIFNLLVKRIPYPDKRLANAHELLGSTMLDDFSDSIFAMEHWRIAHNIRCSGPTYLAKEPIYPPRPAYRNAIEFTTESELELLAADIDSMRIQSLLICERVLGVHHKDTVFRLMFRGAAYADSLRYQRCIDLWIWGLQIRVEKDSILYADTCYSAQALVKIMVDLSAGHLGFVDHDSPFETKLPRFVDVVQVFKLLMQNMKETRNILDIRPLYKKQSEMFDKILKCITHLIYLLIETSTTPEEKNEVHELVSALVRLNIKSASKGDTLLHLSVSSLNVIKSTYFQEDMEARKVFPDYEVVKMLLDCGSYVDAKNDSKSTPLHVACIPYNYSDKLTHLLLSYGAHIDQPNRFGDSPAYLMAKNLRSNVSLLKYISLKCMAAHSVIKNSIPYDNGAIPDTLVQFVKFHEA